MTGKTLAIIPARGGSKRIPRKNVKLFLGKPIISYPIAECLQASCFDTVMVSTEDDEIAELAKGCGAEVPFIRSQENADDYAMTAEVLTEVLREYGKQGIHYEYLCCIYPTSVFATAERLEEAFQLLKQSGTNSVVPVARIGYPIWKAFQIDESGLLKLLWPEKKRVRNNDVQVTYQDAAQFYWLRTEALLAENEIFTDNTLPYVIPEMEAQDIDTEDDWHLAEVKYHYLQQKAKSAQGATF